MQVDPMGAVLASNQALQCDTLVEEPFSSTEIILASMGLKDWLLPQPYIRFFLYVGLETGFFPDHAKLPSVGLKDWLLSQP